MQAVAAEMNLSETAFLLKNGNDFDLRLVYSENGSGTVRPCNAGVGAHPLANRSCTNWAVIRFHTRSGLLEAMEKGNWIELNFPIRHIHPVGEFEGISMRWRLFPMRLTKAKVTFYMYNEDEATVRKLAPDFQR